MTHTYGISRPVMFAFGFTMMLGPFAIDTYLPAFPLIADSLGVSIHSISLSISIYMAGFAVGQLSGGALSDQFGRRRVLWGGFAMFIVASLYLATVESLEAMLGGRLLQSIGGGWIGVSIPALVRDRVQGVQSAKLFSVMGMIVLVAPAIAPAVGAVILTVAPWSMIFTALGLYALALLPMLWFTVFRNHQPRQPGGDGFGVLGRYLGVLRTRPALPYIFWQSASFGGLILFVTYSSYIYQGHYEQSRFAFSLLFAGHIVAMFAGNLVNRVLLNRLTPTQIMRMATLLQAASGIALLLVALLALPVYAFLGAIMLYGGSMGTISPNLHALYLEYFPDSSASASAVMGTASFGLGGLASGISNLLPESLISITTCIALSAFASLGCMLWSRRLDGVPVAEAITSEAGAP